MKGIKWAIPLAAGLMAGTTLGAGFQLYTEGSAEALGMGGAVSGRTNLTSLAWYNPSALAGTERSAIMVGSSFASIHTHFDSDLGSDFDETMEEDWRVIPHLYYVMPLNDDWTGMVSVNAPYGLITEWSDDWIGNKAATYSDLSAIYTTPSIAYRINDKVSVSAGMNIVYSEVELKADRDLSAVPGVGFDFGERKVKGDDVGYGYTASAHWAPIECWGLGVRYQSRVKLKFDGDVYLGDSPFGDTKSDVEGELKLPSTVNFGVANTSIDRLTLGIDFVWTEWSTYDDLTFKFGQDYPLTNPDVVDKSWDDVWSIRVGGEYLLSDSWVLRGGYVWDQSPVEDATRAPELPGSDRQMVMTGLGWTWNDVQIDVAYAFLWADKEKTGADVNASTFGATAGEYDTTTHLVSLSGSYLF